MGVAKDGDELRLPYQDEGDASAGVGLEVGHRFDCQKCVRRGVLRVIDDNDGLSSSFGHGVVEHRFGFEN